MAVMVLHVMCFVSMCLHTSVLMARRGMGQHVRCTWVPSLAPGLVGPTCRARRVLVAEIAVACTDTVTT
jgi:hypothetical protein